MLEQASAGLVAASHAFASDADPLDLVRDFTAVFLSDISQGGGSAEFYLVINQGFITDTPRGTAERLATTQRALWDTFTALVRRGQRTGQFAAGDPVQMTAYYFAMLSGIATMRLVIQDELTKPGVGLVLRLLTGESTT